MTARIIDGKAIAAELRGRVADASHRLARDRGLVPGLAVVLVGSNPASEVYVGSKTKLAAGPRIGLFKNRPAEVGRESGSLPAIVGLNADSLFAGILDQTPIPRHIDGQ